MDNEQFHAVALSRIGGVGPVTGRALIDHFGTASAVFSSSLEELRQLPGIGKKGATHLIGAMADKELLGEVSDELEFAIKYRISVLCYGTASYPTRLRNAPDGPLVLFSKGIAELDAPRVLSVVGTRNATGYGIKICKDLIEALKPLEVTIVSGLAYGIDVAAHQEALNNRLPTLAVLGHGLGTIYPSTHRGVAEQIVKDGALITEYFHNQKASKTNFPQRNRIIAGISDACVVVEAAREGGALITAGIASSYDRPVFAFPGRASDKWSEGCLEIIYNQLAQLVYTPEHIIEQMGWPSTSFNDSESEAIVESTGDMNELTDIEIQLLHFIAGKVKPTFDEISTNFDGSISTVQHTLLMLEMKDRIRRLPGGKFEVA